MVQACGPAVSHEHVPGLQAALSALCRPDVDPQGRLLLPLLGAVQPLAYGLEGQVGAGWRDRRGRRAVGDRCSVGGDGAVDHQAPGKGSMCLSLRVVPVCDPLPTLLSTGL